MRGLASGYFSLAASERPPSPFMPSQSSSRPNAEVRVAPARVGDTLGYARVSTHDQNPDAQSDRLIEAGAIRVFTDIVSGKRFRPPCPGRAHRSRSTRRRFPPLRNSSRPDCHPLEPQNSLALAGQRLTESQRRYVEVETEALRSLKVILRTNLAMTPARAEARVTGHCRTQGRPQRPQSRDTGGEVVI